MTGLQGPGEGKEEQMVAPLCSLLHFHCSTSNIILVSLAFQITDRLLSAFDVSNNTGVCVSAIGSMTCC